jgi:hypothetical protein
MDNTHNQLAQQFDNLQKNRDLAASPLEAFNQVHDEYGDGTLVKQEPGKDKEIAREPMNPGVTEDPQAPLVNGTASFTRPDGTSGTATFYSDGSIVYDCD